MSTQKPPFRPAGSNPTLGTSVKVRLTRTATQTKSTKRPLPWDPTTTTTTTTTQRLCSHCGLPATACTLHPPHPLTTSNLSLHTSAQAAQRTSPARSPILPIPLSAALAAYRLAHHGIAADEAARIMGAARVDRETAEGVMECMGRCFAGWREERKAVHYGMAMGALEGVQGEEVAERPFGRGWWVG